MEKNRRKCKNKDPHDKGGRWDGGVMREGGSDGGKETQLWVDAEGANFVFETVSFLGWIADSMKLRVA